DRAKERSMRHLAIGIALAATLVLIGEPADAQSWRPPTDSQRGPSKWGAGDQRGSANHMKPETVLRATRLIRTGEVIELGHVLSYEMPISSTRRFENLKLDELASKRVYEFAFVMQPLKLKGATGSTVAPIAVR